MIKRVCDFCGKGIRVSYSGPDPIYSLNRGVTNQPIFGLDLCNSCYCDLIAFIDSRRRDDAKEYYKEKENL